MGLKTYIMSISAKPLSKLWALNNFHWQVTFWHHYPLAQYKCHVLMSNGTKNTHMQYESSIAFGLKYIAKVKVSVHATDIDAGADGRAIRWAPWTYLSRLAKKVLKVNVGSSGHMNINVEPRAYKINVGPFWRAMTSQASRFDLSPTCQKQFVPSSGNLLFVATWMTWIRLL